MNGAYPPLILRRRGGRRVVVRLRLRLGAIAFRQRPHILGRWKGDNCFLYLFFLFTKNCDLVHGLDHGHVLGHDHGPVLDVVVLVDLGRTFGWTHDAPKVALPHLRRLWSLYWCA